MKKRKPITPCVTLAASAAKGYTSVPLPHPQQSLDCCRKRRWNGDILTPNGSLERLSIILVLFHRFLFIFRLLVGILPVLFSRRSPLRLQEQDRQDADKQTKTAQALTTDLG